MPALGATGLAGSHVRSTAAAQQLPGGTPTPDPARTPFCVEGDPLNTAPGPQGLSAASPLLDGSSGSPLGVSRDVTLLVFPVKPSGLLLAAGRAVPGQPRWQGAGHGQERRKLA